MSDLHIAGGFLCLAALAIATWQPTRRWFGDLLQRRVDRMVADALAAEAEWAAIEAVLFPSGRADWYGDRAADFELWDREVHS